MARTKSSVITAPGMAHLLVLVLFCFSGFALPLPVSPQRAVHGGADEFGTGLVTAVLMATTVKSTHMGRNESCGIQAYWARQVLR
ncbi:hypothetical protein AB0E27_43050 [Streptomyces sparsogenes]|uniref:hypothetical protein n=1 Tax=Streptomyces sparsogenes TaxID=67365 RepID=UPI0034013624